MKGMNFLYKKNVQVLILMILLLSMKIQNSVLDTQTYSCIESTLQNIFYLNHLVRLE